MKTIPFFIAKRYLISKKSHNAINIISGVSVAGVCVGTIALVVVLSAFNGLSDLVQSLYNSFDPDVKITAVEGKVFDPGAKEIQALKSMEGVAYFSETLEENVLLKNADQQCLATVKGVNGEFVKMTQFDTLVNEGEYLLEHNSVSYAVLGRRISYELSASPGDALSPLWIYAPRRGIVSSINPEDGFNKKSAYVAGVFSINDDFDKKYALLPLGMVRELLGYTNEVSAIELGLSPGTDKEVMQEKISKALGPGYAVKNRYQQNEILFRTLKSEKLWTFIILVFIMVIATFNVIGSLTMLILEKKKDIAILWHMGADASLIRRIFLIEGLMITFIGVGLGILLGVTICLLQQQFGFVTFGDGYVVDAYPVNMMAMDIIGVFAVVMFIGLFAAWYPVRVFTKRQSFV